jgi:type I restriction-modification system DNA methylase subunit
MRIPQLDTFQIMPNHMHGIILLNHIPVGAGFTPAHNNSQPNNDIRATAGVAPAQNDMQPNLLCNINHQPLLDIPEFCNSDFFVEVTEKRLLLVPSKYIEFINRDKSIDFDQKMQKLQCEFADLLKVEEEIKKELLDVFETLVYKIKGL